MMLVLLMALNFVIVYRMLLNVRFVYQVFLTGSEAVRDVRQTSSSSLPKMLVWLNVLLASRRISDSEEPAIV
jgi:hypothetical protein